MTDFMVVLRGLNGVGRIAELSEFVLDEVVWTLNDVDSAKISFDPLYPKAKLIQLAETEIWIYLDEQLSFQGIPRKKSGDASKVTFDVDGVLSYLIYAYITGTDLVQENIDQFNIAWNLISRAQTGVNSDRHIESAAFSPSGIQRSISYLANELPNVWDEVQEFTKLDEGFDFSLEYLPDGRREWTPHYPVRGLYKPEYRLEYDRYGRKWVVNFSAVEDSYNLATETFDSGATLRDNTVEPPTETKLIGHFEDELKSTKYGRAQKVISDTQVEQQTWLDAKAKRYTNAFSDPTDLPDVEVQGALLGLIQPGDVVPVRVDYGVYDIDGDYRITQMKYLGATDTIKLGIQPA